MIQAAATLAMTKKHIAWALICKLHVRTTHIIITESFQIKFPHMNVFCETELDILHGDPSSVTFGHEKTQRKLRSSSYSSKLPLSTS